MIVVSIEKIKGGTKMLKNKKSIELSLTVVVVAAILLFTAVVILTVTRGLFSKESKQAHALIGDYDGDGILDMADKCPCDAGVQEYAGCTSQLQLQDYEKSEDKSKFRSCLIKKT